MYKASNYCHKLPFEYISLSVCLKCWKTEIWFPAQTCANTQLESAHTCTRQQIIVTSYSLSTFLCQFAWSAEDWNLIWVHFSVSLLEVLKTEIWFPAQTCANTQLESAYMYKVSNYCHKLPFEYISLSVCLKCWRLKSDSQHRHVLILN